MKTMKLLLIALVSILTSCSTVVNGTKQNVVIDSNVKGADVNVDGQIVGKTPFNGKIKRGSETVVTLTKDGYSPKTIVMNDEINNAFWVNALFLYGSLSSSTTDYVSGAMYRYSPATYNIELETIKQGK
jgi:hypothetical protein